MKFQSKQLEILLHSVAFKFTEDMEDEEREVYEEVLLTALEARQEYLDELNRIEDESKAGRTTWRPKKSLSDTEKEQRSHERKIRNAKWN